MNHVGEIRGPQSGVRDCAACLDAVTLSLIQACASVGIEHSEATADALRYWLAGYHRRGHKEAM